MPTGNHLPRQVALVTGAGDGIGRGIALALARHGADVAVCDLQRAAVEETAAQITRLGRRTVAGAFDAAEESAVARFVAQTCRTLGPPTILIPNAATMPVVDIAAMTGAQMDVCYGAKVRSAALFTKHCVPPMAQVGGGSIVLMASVTGHVGFARHSFYGAMNAAIIGFARGLAMELAPLHIRVNSVSPGTVDSPMLARYIEASGEDPDRLRAAFAAGHPRGQIASIDEVAATFVFLSSPAAANITAADLRCDGGFSCKGGQAR